ncbi:MAG: GNAT family N-acetyltransferase [Spirochaetales bacterium]|nr:GNAT family N-acetyltransferase [Spirochaetales bacterium]
MIRNIGKEDYHKIARLFFSGFFPTDFEKRYFVPEKTLAVLEKDGHCAFSWFTTLRDIGIAILVFDPAIDDAASIDSLLRHTLRLIPLKELKGLSLISTKRLSNEQLRAVPGPIKRSEIKMAYTKGYIEIPEVKIVTYKEEYFDQELALESRLFYEFRKKHHWEPYRIEDAPEEELENIKKYFDKNRESFFFYFDNRTLVGSTLLVNDFIQSLCIAEEYQRKGYGSLLTKYAVNHALKKGYKIIHLLVFDDNTAAIGMYKKIGFDEKRYQYIY